MNLTYLLEDIGYIIKYDLLNFHLEEPEGFHSQMLSQSVVIKKLAGGGYLVESKDYPALYATGKDLEEVRQAFYDTVLTYFDVPRYYARRRIDDFYLELEPGKRIQAKTAIRNQLASA